MDRSIDLVRRAFAKQVMAAAGVANLQVEQAFATVPRERFLGHGPWRIGTDEGVYVLTPDDNPAHLYTDSVVSILPDRGLNNDQPSFQAKLMAHAAPAAGEHVVHVGAGVGYYSAILAELVGPHGHVTAIEFDRVLAQRTARNLQPWSNVEVIHGDGTAIASRRANIIYVCAGATRPHNVWLDQLAEGGRLVLPLTIETEHDGSDPGAVFCIERRGVDYFARWLSVVAIFPCEGARDPTSEEALERALHAGRMREVTRLYRTPVGPDDDCWLRGAEWCLAYR